MVKTVHVRVKETRGTTYTRNEGDQEVIDQGRSSFLKKLLR